MDLITLGATCIVKNKKLLLLREVGSGKWGPPAGHSDPGETLRQTAIRETKEECGLDVNLTGVVRVSIVKASDGKNYLFAAFTAEAKDIDINLQKEEATEYGWFDADQIRSDKLVLRHPFLKSIFISALTTPAKPLDVFEEIDIKV